MRRGTSDREVALAGKGFGPEVEAKYKERNPTVDFSPIDKMEDMVVSPDGMKKFLKDGGILPAEGGEG